MPRGGARVGAGRKRKSVELHLLHGSYRKDRHGPVLPRGASLVATGLAGPTVGTVALAGAPEADWRPTGQDLATLGEAGRTLLDGLLALYAFDLPEGLQVLELARAADVLASLRAEPVPDARGIRLWSAHYTALLRGLARRS